MFKRKQQSQQCEKDPTANDGIEFLVMSPMGTFESVLKPTGYVRYLTTVGKSTMLYINHQCADGGSVWICEDDIVIIETKTLCCTKEHS